MVAIAVSLPQAAYPDFTGSDDKSRCRRVCCMVKTRVARIFEMKADERDTPVTSMKTKDAIRWNGGPAA